MLGRLTILVTDPSRIRKRKREREQTENALSIIVLAALCRLRSLASYRLRRVWVAFPGPKRTPLEPSRGRKRLFENLTNVPASLQLTRWFRSRAFSSRVPFASVFIDRSHAPERRAERARVDGRAGVGGPQETPQGPSRARVAARHCSPVPREVGLAGGFAFPLPRKRQGLEGIFPKPESSKSALRGSSPLVGGDRPARPAMSEANASSQAKRSGCPTWMEMREPKRACERRLARASTEAPRGEGKEARGKGGGRGMHTPRGSEALRDAGRSRSLSRVRATDAAILSHCHALRASRVSPRGAWSVFVGAEGTISEEAPLGSSKRPSPLHRGRHLHGLPSGML